MRTRHTSGVAQLVTANAELRALAPLPPEPPAASWLQAEMQSHLRVVERMLERQLEATTEAARLTVETLSRGKKVLICGNGGSAADAQHLAAEFTGRFLSDRRALPAIALTTDSSALTAIANDYGYERIFSRQVEALAAPGDQLIAISTSGDSPNVLLALQVARALGCSTLGLLGGDGGAALRACDQAVVVPSGHTARIQEVHSLVGHVLCEAVERWLRR